MSRAILKVALKPREKLPQPSILWKKKKAKAGYMKVYVYFSEKYST